MADDKATERHSPLPWHIAARTSDMIIAADKARVADCAIAFGMAALEAEANAELIVTAVNSYDNQRDTIEALVDAARLALATLETLAQIDAESTGVDVETCEYKGTKELRAVLALAKENQNG